MDVTPGSLFEVGLWPGAVCPARGAVLVQIPRASVCESPCSTNALETSSRKANNENKTAADDPSNKQSNKTSLKKGTSCTQEKGPSEGVRSRCGCRRRDVALRIIQEPCWSCANSRPPDRFRKLYIVIGLHAQIIDLQQLGCGFSSVGKGDRSPSCPEAGPRFIPNPGCQKAFRPPLLDPVPFRRIERPERRTDTGYYRLGRHCCIHNACILTFHAHELIAVSQSNPWVIAVSELKTFNLGSSMKLIGIKVPYIVTRTPVTDLYMHIPQHLGYARLGSLGALGAYVPGGKHLGWQLEHR
ncbi:hypothetical protein AG1IA_02787 [Rhizoctonia solani AG-1 IA]|uniref:Uncharacterized protein n=1 Tax=Thanatephorus cucumeris (strain AG1-IA) TaxID=983506 RepID=L8WYY3_THACA|nr:hypothetical protein AG1IA_02787 [Rhizoctonia solani AG-1 IA]